MVDLSTLDRYRDKKAEREIIRAAIAGFYERTKSGVPATPDK